MKLIQIFLVVLAGTMLVVACDSLPSIEGTQPGECSDGADNDGDGDYDCNDSDCAGAPACEGEIDEPSSPPELLIRAFSTDVPYASIDNENLIIDLGEVAIYDSLVATFLVENSGAENIHIESLNYISSETSGTMWGDVTWRNDSNDTLPKLPPLDVPPGEARLIDIPFAPMAEGILVGVVGVQIRGSDQPPIKLTVKATGTYFGRPDIEIEYNGMTGPDLQADCSSGVCVMPTAFDFGNVGVNSTVTAQLILRNTARCEPYPGGDACMSCALTIMNEPSFYDIGIGFKEGTNLAGAFSFAGSTQTPIQIPQQDVDCGNSGEFKFLINFDAPNEEGDFSTVVIVESNDPDEPVVEIPIITTVRNIPIAIASIRECNETVLTDCTPQNEIEPLSRVFLNGSESYSPNGGTITQYQWEVIEAPQGLNPDDYDWTGANSNLASFWLPLNGEYTVRLTVWDDSGVQSQVTDQADISFVASSSELIHVQLVWDHPSNDQDLHLTHASEDGHFCSTTKDCFFSNKQPVWFSTHAAGEGPNPVMTKDDTNGLGPENIVIDEPAAGVYRVFAHYYPWSSAGAPTVNTVRVYLDGSLHFAEQRTLTSEEQVWAVADISWYDDGSEDGYGEVTPYPSPDGSEQVGEIAIRDSSACYSAGGWIFPSEADD